MIRKTKPAKRPQRARQFSSHPLSSRLKSPAKVSSRKTPWAISTTLERACELLKLFTPKKPRWTISELARYLNVPKSGVFRLVKTFERKHFLRCHDGTYEYELGSEIWELTGAVFGAPKRLVERASPYLIELNRITGLLVSLRILEDDRMVILDRVEGHDPVKVNFPVGTHQPCNHGAPGKLLLAYRYPTDKQFREFFLTAKIDKLTERTLTDQRQLQDELNKIRRVGYAVSDGEAIRGTIGLAAPVWSSAGRVEAALALTAVESLCNMKQLLKFLPDLKHIAELISRELGYARQSFLANATS